MKATGEAAHDQRPEGSAQRSMGPLSESKKELRPTLPAIIKDGLKAEQADDDVPFRWRAKTRF